MRLETIAFEVLPTPTLQQNSLSNIVKIRGAQQNEPSELTDLQKQYLEVLIQQKSIENVVQYYLKNGWLVNFNQLWKLIVSLDQKGRLLPTLKQAAQPEQNLKDLRQIQFESFCKLPFYRSLPKKILDEFWASKKIITASPNQNIIRKNSRDRSLWTQLSGQSAIYESDLQITKRLVGIVDPGASFGELGFFLGEPRTADIETLSASTYLKIEMTDQIEPLIKASVVQSLKYRFQVLRAFVHSSLFKHLSEASMDELIFCGRLHLLNENHVLFKQGDSGSSCFIVIEGNVGIYQDESVINILRQGSTLGEVALFYSGGKRTASAITQTHTVLLEINQVDFYRVLSQNINLAMQLESLTYERIRKDQERKKSRSAAA